MHPYCHSLLAFFLLPSFPSSLPAILCLLLFFVLSPFCACFLFPLSPTLVSSLHFCFLTLLSIHPSIHACIHLCILACFLAWFLPSFLSYLPCNFLSCVLASFLTCLTSFSSILLSITYCGPKGGVMRQDIWDLKPIFLFVEL